MSGDQVAGNGKQLADYPMVGFTEDRVTVTTNQFDFSNAPTGGGFRYVQVISIASCTSTTAPCRWCRSPCSAGRRRRTRTARRRSRSPRLDRRMPIHAVPDLARRGRPDGQADPVAAARGERGPQAVAGPGLRRARSRSPRSVASAATSGLDTKWDTGDLRVTSAFWDAARDAVRRDPGNVGGGAAEAVVRWWEVDPRRRSPTLTSPGRRRSGAGRYDVPSIATDGDGNALGDLRAGRHHRVPRGLRLRGPPGRHGLAPILLHGDGRYEVGRAGRALGHLHGDLAGPVGPDQMATYGAFPLDDGIGGSETDLWQQVVATVTDA